MSENDKDKPRLPRRPRAKPAKPLGDHEVGYGRPPAHTRFAPGQSGNPKGRPKSARSLKEVLDRELNSKVTVNDRGRARQLTKREVLGRQTVDRALKGDNKAIRLLRDYDIARGGPDGSAPQPGPVVAPPVDATDREILAAFAALIRSGADVLGPDGEAENAGDLLLDDGED